MACSVRTLTDIPSATILWKAPILSEVSGLSAIASLDNYLLQPSVPADTEFVYLNPFSLV
jgi:hypothetical protein